MSVSVAITVTSLVWILLFMFIGLIYVIGMAQHNRKHFIDLCLRTKTGGKPQIDLVKAQLYRSKKYGNFIYVKKRKMPIPRFDQEFFLPRRKSGRMFLDVTTSDGYYYANRFNSLLDKLKKNIILHDDEGKPYSFNDKNELNEFLKQKYKVADYTDIGGMVNQIPHVDRSQAAQIDEILDQLNEDKPSFWKSPQFIFVSALVISSILVIVIFVLALQHAQILAGGAPDASGGVANMAANFIQNGTKPPTP